MSYLPTVNLWRDHQEGYNLGPFDPNKPIKTEPVSENEDGDDMEDFRPPKQKRKKVQKKNPKKSPKKSPKPPPKRPRQKQTWRQLKTSKKTKNLSTDENVPSDNKSEINQIETKNENNNDD